ncbi:PD-(D/E)XK nuclease family protein [Pedobacter helvus]|uniref:PD-(D/E)XK nuclease family protein n=1 Tax=Pedobacter helvus TaxID=2563444 RepID=A0ABW9JGE8_9SPHI|nr:PD-(D/E)XK nuclease family protein [Pedobacter ureilyticus]
MSLNTNLFGTLLKLYKANGIRTPLEDFTTEILVHILNQNESIMSKFVNKVLKIEGYNFVATSQETFVFKQRGRHFCKVDVVFRNENKICFLENKVHSEEGFDQLINYSDTLDEQSEYQEKHLRYCTKFYEDKIHITKNHFSQFRWCNISNFLQEWKDNDIIKQFLEFLENNQMGNSTDFTLQEILSLQSISPALLKMSSYLDKIRPRFVEQFGALASINNSKQLTTYNRQVIVKQPLFGEGYSEIGAGFDFSTSPKLIVWIWVGKGCTEFAKFKELVAPTEIYHNDEYLEVGKPLSDFISSENMELDIEKWFIYSFDIVKSVIKDNQHLTWHVPNIV